ncbi:MAG: hypothetical protein E2584_05570, partial [Microbacterium sp.]|nr:hypothetical protein [Microbacterium sp.]
VGQRRRHGGCDIQGKRFGNALAEVGGKNKFALKPRVERRARALGRLGGTTHTQARSHSAAYIARGDLHVRHSRQARTRRSRSEVGRRLGGAGHLPVRPSARRGTRP